MNTNSNHVKSIDTHSQPCTGWALILIVLGIVALYGGTIWLGLLIPVSILVWYGARPTPRSSRD